MSYKLTIKPDAETDLEESAKWYNAQRANLGIEFLDEVEEVLERVISNPFLFQQKYRKVRIAFCRRFPYGIYFTLEKKEAVIHAVLHTSRHPMVWKRRAKSN